jgi:hypothetical protein
MVVAVLVSSGYLGENNYGPGSPELARMDEISVAFLFASIRAISQTRICKPAEP